MYLCSFKFSDYKQNRLWIQRQQRQKYLFESSWEVCNKVGGIYTVLSTKAHTLQQMFNDKVVFIGPDVWGPANAPDFIEDDASVC